jgi:hypothetical protein
VSGENVSTSETAPHTVKRYLQQEKSINQHAMWQVHGFWEDALLNGIKSQLDLMEPVLWDELEPDVLKEKVIGMHIWTFIVYYLSLV